MNSIEPASPEAEDDLSEYRQWLIAAEQTGQGDFDKAVLSLSGGALAISFAFVKDILGPGPIADTSILLLAWLCWAMSSGAILASFYFGNLALRKAVEQCDNRTIRCEPPGGYFASITKGLNATGAALFFIGVLLMSIFIYCNLSTRDQSHVRTQHATSATNSSTPAATTEARARPSK